MNLTKLVLCFVFLGRQLAHAKKDPKPNGKDGKKKKTSNMNLNSFKITVPAVSFSQIPSQRPSIAPSSADPSLGPTFSPSISPTIAPNTSEPIYLAPSLEPTVFPSIRPNNAPSAQRPPTVPTLNPQSFALSNLGPAMPIKDVQKGSINMMSSPSSVAKLPSTVKPSASLQPVLSTTYSSPVSSLPTNPSASNKIQNPLDLSTISPSSSMGTYARKPSSSTAFLSSSSTNPSTQLSKSPSASSGTLSPSQISTALQTSSPIPDIRQPPTITTTLKSSPTGGAQKNSSSTNLQTQLPSTRRPVFSSSSPSLKSSSSMSPSPSSSMSPSPTSSMSPSPSSSMSPSPTSSMSPSPSSSMSPSPSSSMSPSPASQVSRTSSVSPSPFLTMSPSPSSPASGALNESAQPFANSTLKNEASNIDYKNYIIINLYLTSLTEEQRKEAYDERITKAEEYSSQDINYCPSKYKNMTGYISASNIRSEATFDAIVAVIADIIAEATNSKVQRIKTLPSGVKSNSSESFDFIHTRSLLSKFLTLELLDPNIIVEDRNCWVHIRLPLKYSVLMKGNKAGNFTSAKKGGRNSDEVSPIPLRSMQRIRVKSFIAIEKSIEDGSFIGSLHLNDMVIRNVSLTLHALSSEGETKNRSALSPVFLEPLRITGIALFLSTLCLTMTLISVAKKRSHGENTPRNLTLPYFEYHT